MTGIANPLAAARPTLAEREQAVVTPALYHFTDIELARGLGCEIWDLSGKRYIDFAAGIAALNVGHCHPRVVAAVTDQVNKLMHGAAHIGLMEPYVEIVERIRSHAPAPLDQGKAILVNSGSEAVEAALKMARMVTGRSVVLAFLSGFHGRAMGALGATASNSVYRRGLAGLLPGVVHVPYPTCEHCPFGHEGRNAGSCCGTWRMQIDLVLSKLVHPDDLAAILVEPVLGEGGYFVPPPDFMLGLRQIADDTGALLITDEVQTGLGRTGMWFGVDHSGVTPDVMILSKALGGGLPLGGILGKAELMDRWLTGSHGSTYGGNPVCCRSGIESIRIIEDEDLVDRARIIGDRIRNRLQAAGLPQVGPVRGLGLMLAVEVHDDDGQMASPAAVNQFVRDLATAGVITTVCGKQYVRISPPLILDEALADEGVDRMLEVLAASGVH